MLKNNFFRSRKSITPLIDIYEEEDNKRRDSSGRKRVDVIHCLFESSSDENDDTDLINQNSTNILWLTFAEICHIRSVLAQTTLSTLMFNKSKQDWKNFHEHLCFRCHQQIHFSFLIPSFLCPTNTSICYICQQRICQKCSISNFIPPSSKHVFPVRIQTLIKSSSLPTAMESETSKKINSNPQTKIVCYDCSQVTVRF